MSSRQTFPFLQALEHSHVPSAVLVPSTGVISWINPAAKALIGDVRGQNWLNSGRLTPEGIKASIKAWEETLSRGPGGSVAYDTVILAPDGTEIPVVASSTLLNAGGVDVVFRQFYPKPAESEVTRTLRRKLSDRQVDILRLIAAGHTTEEIAEELHIEVSTVRTHEARIRGILRVKSRAAAVAIAYQEGLL